MMNLDELDQIKELAAKDPSATIQETEQYLIQIKEKLEELVISAGVWLIRAVLLIILFLILRKVTKKVIGFIEDRLNKRNVPRSLTAILAWLIEYGLLIYIVVRILLSLNMLKSASIAATIAAIGLGISLALQGAMSNFAGGLLLIMLKPFKEGDYIIVDSGKGIEGTVDHIHVYYTTIIDVYNQKVRVPNSALTNHTIVNQMADRSRRLELHVGIGYDDDIDHALEVIKNVVNADERIRKDKQAFFVHELGAHSIILGLRCVVERQDYLQVRWDLNRSIRLKFAEEGITIPYEQLDVHITNA
jgi:small conductance mechanosensitive channel